MTKKIFVILIFIETVFINNCISNTMDNSASSNEVILIKKDTTPVENDLKQATPVAVASPKTDVKVQNVTKTAKKSEPIMDKEKISYVLNKLKENQAGRIAMCADVVLKTYYAQQTPQVVKGNIIIKKNDKFKIHYTEPTEQFLISNGKLIWIYTPELKQVIKQNAEDSKMGTNFYIEMESSIEYYVNQSKTYINEDEKSYTLTLYPKDKKTANFEKIVIKINKEKIVPEYIGMLYQGVLTRVYFNNVRNYTAEQAKGIREFNDNNFEFVTPEGVEEIDTSLLPEIK
ncbi:MAG TPA: outer membrane lipoprotein carrier protein LolA [Candidatus Goldiibacteriota bacterium]|nr:outer membrane lipoprotein carrier protein LolA [Candidatus Goldiibacteriota bacterium]